jgi:hypothetical protein
MPCSKPCKLLSSLRVLNSLCKFIAVLPSLISVVTKTFFEIIFMSGDAPQPKESKTAFKISYARCVRGSASSFMSGRTGSAILPFCQQALEFCHEHCVWDATPITSVIELGSLKAALGHLKLFSIESTKKTAVGIRPRVCSVFEPYAT